MPEFPLECFDANRGPSGKVCPEGVDCFMWQEEIRRSSTRERRIAIPFNQMTVNFLSVNKTGGVVRFYPGIQ